MSDPMLLQTQTSGAPGGPAADTTPPAAPPPASQAGDPSGTQEFTVTELAYLTQLGKPLLGNKEALAKLAKQGRTIDQLADGYLKSQETLSQHEAELASYKGRTFLPGPEAKPEDWDPVFKALGRPDAPDGYQFKREGDLAKVPSLPGLDEWTAKQYHELGLSKTQGEELFRRNGQKVVEMAAQLKAQQEAKAADCVKELERRKGKDYADFRVNLDKAVESFFGPDAMDDPWNNPNFLEKLGGLVTYMSDAAIKAGGAAPGTNPWADTTFNLTEQGKILRENPTLARSLATAAGKPMK